MTEFGPELSAIVDVDVPKQCGGVVIVSLDQSAELVKRRLVTQSVGQSGGVERSGASSRPVARDAAVCDRAGFGGVGRGVTGRYYGKSSHFWGKIPLANAKRVCFQAIAACALAGAR